MKKKKNAVDIDTAKLTVLSLAMQSAGMAFNVVLSGKAGTAAVGIMSLIFSLFGFIMVLANGNIFVAASRFVSEARGAGHRNYSQVMRYALTFSLCLSGGFALISFAFAGILGERLLKSAELASAVRIISLSLPFAAAGSCIKGYFHGIRSIDVPMKGDFTEFAAKWIFLFAALVFTAGTDRFYIMIALSVLVGEAASFAYYIRCYISEYRRFSVLPVSDAPLLTDTPLSFLKNILPILVSGYVQMLLSAANEAIVPVALLHSSMSAETALSEYGMFEAMIIPAIFFPSAVLTSMSNIIIPECARSNRIGDFSLRCRRLSEFVGGIFEKAFSYAFFIACVYLFSGYELGLLLCPENDLVGRSIVILAPVIPFIYLEIVLEGMLKGMGRQNFSTLNSLAEYAVRIVCVVVFVRLFGFYGVLISYYASNVLSNIARIIVVSRETELRFSVIKYVIIPLFRGMICCLAGALACTLSHAGASGKIAYVAVFFAASLTVYVFIGEAVKMYKSRLENKYVKSG